MTADIPDYTIDDIMKVMFAEVVVYETRDPEKNRQRKVQQENQIRILAENIMMGPIRGGCRNEVECENIFGTDEWSALRRGILLRDPMCRICGLRPSKEVHHIRPRFLKGKNHPRNLIGLCLECHDEVHRRINQGIKEVLERSLDINPSNDPYHKQTAKLDDWMGGIE